MELPKKSGFRSAFFTKLQANQETLTGKRMRCQACQIVKANIFWRDDGFSQRFAQCGVRTTLVATKAEVGLQQG